MADNMRDGLTDDQLWEIIESVPAGIDGQSLLSIARAAVNAALLVYGDEPYGYLRELDGNVQLSIGAQKPADRAGGYATPWAAIYKKPQLAPVAAVPNMSEMINRFLSWPLPKSVCPDGCALNTEYPHRSGTHLLTAYEARQMLEHVLAAQPAALVPDEWSKTIKRAADMLSQPTVHGPDVIESTASELYAMLAAQGVK